MNDFRILARFNSADGQAPFDRMKAVLWDLDLPSDIAGPTWLVLFARRLGSSKLPSRAF